MQEFPVYSSFSPGPPPELKFQTSIVANFHLPSKFPPNCKNFVFPNICGDWRCTLAGAEPRTDTWTQVPASSADAGSFRPHHLFCGANMRRPRPRDDSKCSWKISVGGESPQSYRFHRRPDDWHGRGSPRGGMGGAGFSERWSG